MQKSTILDGNSPHQVQCIRWKTTVDPKMRTTQIDELVKRSLEELDGYVEKPV